MKIRNGFVSNSSSSSFCLVARKEEFHEVLNESPDIIKHLVNTNYRPIQDAWGSKMIVFAGEDSTEDMGLHLNDFNGDLIDFDGNVVMNDFKSSDDYSIYDLEAKIIMSEWEALIYISKKMKQKGYDSVLASYC